MPIFARVFGVSRLRAATSVVAPCVLAGLMLGCTTGEPESATPSAETNAAPAPTETPTVPKACAPSCGMGEACNTDADCMSDYCSASLCQTATAEAHSDGRKNAGETDIDCGGASKIPCAAGGKCKTSDDCISTCESGICAGASDSDGKKNNEETDVDCGGPNAKKCGVGKVCVANADCGLGYCKDSACVAPTSTDAVKNGTETDIDCGGAAQTFDGVSVAAAPKCALGKTCGIDIDCGSSVCAENNKCIEAPSCRQVHGGQTCGTGEFGVAGAQHDSCCKSFPVPGVTISGKQVYLDKYEITAGRIRQWIKAIKAQYGGVPNIQGWVKTRMAQDSVLAAMFPAVRADQKPPAGPANTADYLPAVAWGQPVTFPLAAGGSAAVDMGLQSQIGPTSFYRGLQIGGTSGCAMYPGSYGHRTYWFNAAEAAEFGELTRPADQQAWLDEKSMNCMTPLMYAAFCAWDGGYMPSQATWYAAWGSQAWPWGAGPNVNDEVAKIANFNAGTSGFGLTKAPRYLFPAVNYGTFANDFSPIIASPGRFPGDKASVVRPGQETWMDMGGNMLEWMQTGGNFYGWSGSSFEGHNYQRSGNSLLYFLDKYGKGSARCMRLK